MRNVHTAKELVEKAWAARRKVVFTQSDSSEHRQNSMDKVRKDLVEAIAIFREADVKQELVHALRKLGHVEKETGREEQTKNLYEEAVIVSRASGDTLLLAHSTRHLGDFYRDAGNTETALLSYDEAITLYRNHEHPPKLDFANAIRSMAILREDSSMIESARSLWLEALKLYTECDIQEGVDECSQHLRLLEAD